MRNRKLVIAIMVAVAVLVCVGAAVGLYLAVEAGVIPNPHGPRSAIETLIGVC